MGHRNYLEGECGEDKREYLLFWGISFSFWLKGSLPQGPQKNELGAGEQVSASRSTQDKAPINYIL